jgi:hypothetical protein
VSGAGGTRIHDRRIMSPARQQLVPWSLAWAEMGWRDHGWPIWARIWHDQAPCRHLGYGRVVPRISAFYGVVIYMYWNERDHPVAHFHAYHAGRRASVSADGVVLAGSLESRALGFVQEWASLRHDEIMANWERARKNEPLLAIPPLP